MNSITSMENFILILLWNTDFKRHIHLKNNIMKCNVILLFKMYWMCNANYFRFLSSFLSVSTGVNKCTASKNCIKITSSQDVIIYHHYEDIASSIPAKRDHFQRLIPWLWFVFRYFFWIIPHHHWFCYRIVSLRGERGIFCVKRWINVVLNYETLS
jgi:hypothetical protein